MSSLLNKVWIEFLRTNPCIFLLKQSRWMLLCNIATIIVRLNNVYLVAAKEFIKGNLPNHNSPCSVQIIQEHFCKVNPSINMPESFPRVSKIVPFLPLICDQDQRKLSETLAHSVCQHVCVCVCTCWNLITFYVNFSLNLNFPGALSPLYLSVCFLFIFPLIFGKKIDKFPWKHFYSNKL